MTTGTRTTRTTVIRVSRDAALASRSFTATPGGLGPMLTADRAARDERSDLGGGPASQRALCHRPSVLEREGPNRALHAGDGRRARRELADAQPDEDRHRRLVGRELAADGHGL